MGESQTTLNGIHAEGSLSPPLLLLLLLVSISSKAFKIVSVIQAECKLQVTKFKKYKIWDLKVQLYIVIVLSCLLIGSLSSSSANHPVIRGHLKTIAL